MSSFTLRKALLASTVACVGLVANVLLTQEDVYAALHYVVTEKWALMILYAFALALICNLGEFFTYLFIGTLRPLEAEQVQDRIVHGFLVDTVLFLVLSTPTINSKEVSTGSLMICIACTTAAKTLHLICQIRISQALELGTMAQRSLQRLYLLVLILWTIDWTIISFLFPLLTRQSSFYFWIFFEGLAMFCSASVSFLKLVVYTIDSALNGLWIWKSTLLFHLDLTNDVLSLTIYLVSMLVVLIVNPTRMPFWVVAEILQFGRALFLRLRSYRRYRALTASMDRRFPHPTPEELAEAETCIICRDSLAIDTSLKLPCGHVLHSDCLRSWFVQQQSCPTCRFSLDPESPEVSPEYGTEVAEAPPNVELPDNRTEPTAPPTETKTRYPPHAKIMEEWEKWLSRVEGEWDPEDRIRRLHRECAAVHELKQECLRASQEAYSVYMEGEGEEEWVDLTAEVLDLRRRQITRVTIEEKWLTAEESR